MAKKKQFVTAAAAFAVAASAVAPAITADAAMKTVRLSSDYVRVGDLDATLDKTYNGGEIYWYKSSVDLNKLGVFQTAKGFVKGQGIRVEKRVRVLNHAQEIKPTSEFVFEQGVPVSGIRVQPVLFADGNEYLKPLSVAGFNTDKVGEFEGTLTYANRAYGVVTKTVKYKVVKSEVEISNVSSSVDQATEVLSVTADVKNLKDGEKVELVVYPGKDMSATPIKEEAMVKDGKLTVSKKLPAGMHSFQLVSGDVKTEVMNFTIEAPMVKEVKAINGKDHVVEFNKAVDEITAENKANYEISVNNAAALLAADYTVTVDEKDPTKVHITLADGSALSNGAYVSVKVKKAILDKNLKPLADDYTKTFTFVDNSAATIEKVEVDGNDLKVTFNDYISAVGLVKVNGAVKAATAASPYSKELVISGGATGLANGAYTVQIANVEDIANVNGVGSTNLTTFTSGNFTISDVTVAPMVSKVEKVDEDTFKITFNKGVTAPTVTTKKNGLSLDTTVNATADAKVWEVDVADNGGVLLYNAGETSVNLALNISAFKATSDNVVGDAVNQSVTLSKDTAGPVVETRFNEIVDIDAGATVDEVFNIKFNEEIQNVVPANIILTDKDGIRRAVTNATIVNDANSNATILQVKSTAIQSSTAPTTGSILAGTYTLSLGAGTVEDMAGNDLSSTTVSFTKATGTTTDFAVTATAAGNVITLPFGTPMTNSAIDLSNYKLDNKALPAGTIAYFDGSKEDVTIELPAGSIARSQDAVLTVSSNVVSEAGAKLDTASRNQVISGLLDNVKPTLVSAKKLTSTTVEVTFSENLDTFTDGSTFQDDYIVKVNGVNFTVSAVADGTASDNKVVLSVPAYNVDQTLTVTMADSNITIADAEGNTAVAKTSVTATK
ncbi:hypothetical protein PTI97_11100 [Exiguobacterium marinum]|uniref:Ig-like domain (Group 3) n=1 Tax=Exiguobacterium marinum TaxID=273528 RepID=A0ABY7X353_9BACL|nr:hypothetical protein [Exiguobacterium marinum]WDH75364.1 hypothetical protein PTI97_11100 [Exiguobacterium marinum]